MNSEEMNITGQIFPTDGSNSSTYIFFVNMTEAEDHFNVVPVLFFLNVLFGLPINSYVIWLIVTGTGNGLAAEIFSLNLAVCEICLCVESVFLFLSYEFDLFWIAAFFLDGLAVTSRPLFQSFICVERYLAVVHPLTFLKYKPLRYRVICCVVVWVGGFVFGGVSVNLVIFHDMLYCALLLAQFFLFISLKLFCCLAVLRALKQSGPGERGREREEENHTKRRAFYLILITTVSTLILYTPYIILISLFRTSYDHTTFFISFFFILAGLVQPLLFLYRVRKLPFIS